MLLQQKVSIEALDIGLCEGPAQYSSTWTERCGANETMHLSTVLRHCVNVFSPYRVLVLFWISIPAQWAVILSDDNSLRHTIRPWWLLQIYPRRNIISLEQMLPGFEETEKVCRRHTDKGQGDSC